MRTLYTNFRWPFSDDRQSMLAEGGRVLDRGPHLIQDPDAAVEDLGGRYLLPGFVDAHCHILPTGLDLQKLYLGDAASEEELLDLVRRRHQDEPEGWLLGVRYDPSKWSGEHVTRDRLDKISASRPILLRHVSGHMSAANSAALQAAGVDESTPDPSGGVYGRDASGRLDGTLFEDAHDRVSKAVPTPTLDQMVDAILRAGEKMRALGITAATDMMTGGFDLFQEIEAYRLAAERGCPIHVRLTLQWREVFGPRATSRDWLESAVREMRGLPAPGKKSVRVMGIKIFSDGALSSRTAAIYGEYGSDDFAPDRSRTSGQLIYRPERLNEMVRIAHEAGYGVVTHAIGDYATDLVMDAYEATGAPERHRIEHVMMLSDAQIERLARLGCPVAMQPEFLMRLASAYRRSLSPGRVASLNRIRSVMEAGVPVGFSSDRPVVPGDPWDGIDTAVARPEGFDPAENVSREEAILAYTREAARIDGDENEMGALLPGMYADFQLYEENPLTAARPGPIQGKKMSDACQN